MTYFPLKNDVWIFTINYIYPCETFDVVEKTRKNFDMWKEEQKFRSSISLLWLRYINTGKVHIKKMIEKKII
jgi:hypothetical protein